MIQWQFEGWIPEVIQVGALAAGCSVLFRSILSRQHNHPVLATLTAASADSTGYRAPAAPLTRKRNSLLHTRTDVSSYDAYRFRCDFLDPAAGIACMRFNTAALCLSVSSRKLMQRLNLQ